MTASSTEKMFQLGDLDQIFNRTILCSAVGQIKKKNHHSTMALYFLSFLLHFWTNPIGTFLQENQTDKSLFAKEIHYSNLK